MSASRGGTLEEKVLNRLLAKRKFDTGNGFIIREGGNPFFFFISLSLFFSFLILSHSFDFRSFSFRALTGLNPDISN
jgi:hypothetical protein